MVAPGSDDGRLHLLQEMVRQSERVIDHQVRAMQELDDKSEQMIRLAIAALAGGVALGLVLVRSAGSPAHPAVASAIAGSVLNLLSLLMLVEGYVGILQHSELHVGPALSWVRAQSIRREWSLEAHLVQVLDAFPDFQDYNLDRMARAALWRRRGLYGLLLSVLAYGAAYGYILLERILA